MLIQLLYNEEIRRKKWYIFYTSPRAEKKANEYLQSAGYESFLPLRKELRTWKNRQRKYIEEPLFPSYIFVRTQNYNLFHIAKLPKICYCLTMNGNPVTIPDQDIEAIRCMLQSDKVVNVEHENLHIGDKIIIIEGDLIGYQGILLYCRGEHKFGIQLAGTNYVACINIDLNKVKILK